MKNNRGIKNHCRTIVQPNGSPPIARYISDGSWAVTSDRTLVFSIVCKESKQTSQFMTINPHLGMIHLPKECSASKDYLTLLPYYHKESQYNNKQPLDILLQSYNMTQIN